MESILPLTLKIILSSLLLMRKCGRIGTRIVGSDLVSRVIIGILGCCRFLLFLLLSRCYTRFIALMRTICPLSIINSFLMSCYILWLKCRQRSRPILMI